MRYYSLLLFVLIIGSAKSSPKVDRIHPKGFRISVPYAKPYDVPSIKIYGTINRDLPMGVSDTQPDFVEILTELTNGRWIYDNINRDTPPGTSINYIISPPNRLETVILTEDTISITQTCVTSLTTVNRKTVCKGDLIFEENFDTLNSNVWRKEVRIPLEDEGSPFVSYQNRSENCFVKNGVLNIVPTLLSNVPGFDESSIRKGELQLEDCVSLQDVSKECHRKAQYSQILPPTVSAKINTKRSFSFRYGKLVIRAKMPQGDWMVPLIQLDPLENYYGSTNYSSGQVKLAYMRGNAFFQTEHYKDRSRIVYYGLVLSSRHLPEMFRRFPEAEDNNLNGFRDYTFTWSDDKMTFGTDAYEGRVGSYFIHQLCGSQKVTHCNRWKDNGKMAPFDREFYITLGVSVGGHEDFPEKWTKPWNNYDPKAELNFWNDRNNWLKTWTGDDDGLQIDSIKVYAV